MPAPVAVPHQVSMVQVDVVPAPVSVASRNQVIARRSLLLNRHDEVVAADNDDHAKSKRTQLA